MKNINKIISSVLLVDDDDISNFYNESVLRENLEFKGTINVCLNGKEALDYLKNEGQYSSSTGTYPCPDLILLDINMPVMDGFEFLKSYESLKKRFKGKIVIVMLTSSLNEGDKLKAVEMGLLSDYLNKPMDTDILLDIIEEYFYEK